MKAVHKKDRPDIPSVCLCVFTSKSSLQQSRGSDPLLPRPLILLKAPPIFSIHVCRVVIAEGTLPLTHTHTHKRTLNTTELCFFQQEIFTLIHSQRKQRGCVHTNTKQCDKTLPAQLITRHSSSTRYMTVTGRAGPNVFVCSLN